jgi:signal peptidase I
MDPNLSVGTLRELWQQSNESHWLPVCGTSMLPLLREGDRILVSHELSEVQQGDILVFQQEEGLVAHRVVRITKNNGERRIYQTKGDNCAKLDSPLSEAEVLGVVNLVSRDGKEYDLTTLRWRLPNSLLATIHLLIGNLIQIFRKTKHQP